MADFDWNDKDEPNGNRNLRWEDDCDGWGDNDDWHDERGNGRGGECDDCPDDSDEGDCDDEGKLYRDFLDNLHSCQVVCSDEAAVFIGRNFRPLADAIVDGFYAAGSSEEVVTEGRNPMARRWLDWSIYCFDRTELHGWNEFGYPEDFMLRLFVSLSRRPKRQIATSARQDKRE